VKRPERDGSSRIRGAALVVAAALWGCAERHPGIEVALFVEVSAQPTGAARVELEGAVLHVSWVRGVPCGETVARAWSPVSTAWAHGGHADTDPLRVEVDRPVDLTSPAPQALAVLRPAPGVWCAVELEFGPADDTATSLLVDARRSGSSRRYLSAGTRRVRLARLPLVLDAEGRRDLHLLLDAGPTLASLDPATTDARRELLDTLLASMRWNDP
jgi:hypothetical protein